MQIFSRHVLSDNLISFPDFEKTENNGVAILIQSHDQVLWIVKYHRVIVLHLVEIYMCPTIDYSTGRMINN